MNVFIRLTVKDGHSETDLTCEAPWPPLRCIYPQSSPPAPWLNDKKWTDHQDAFLLDLPKIDLTRNRSPGFPINNLSIHDDKIKLYSTKDIPESKPTHTGTMSLLRAITLREIYKGTDANFSDDVSELIRHYMNPPPESMTTGIALTHPELLEYARDTFNIETIETVPMGIPTSMDISPPNPRSPSHLFASPPIFSNPTPPLMSIKWATSPSTNTKNTAICIHHMANRTVKLKYRKQLEDLAVNHRRGFILLETSNLDQSIFRLKLLPKLRHIIKIEHVFTLCANSIHWTNHNGQNLDSPNKHKKCPGWYFPTDTNTQCFMGPTNDGRWDLPRSNVSSLNRNPIVALLFHHVHDVIALDHNHTRHLADIIARISAPPHPGKSIEHNIPILTWNKSKISLALRHQAFVPGDKIDIFRKIRDANFSCIKIPSCPNYTPTYRTFSPLLALKDKEIIPDGSVIQQLINYCTALEPYEPKIATYTVTATLLQCIKSMEDIRYDKALHIVYMIGCPTAHLENDTSSLDTTLTCQNCDRQVTTLWEITPKPFITHPTKNYKERTLIISDTTKKLISAEFKAQQLTNSSFPTPSENILTSFHESLPTYTCYLCAIPTIIETCTNNSRNPKKNITTYSKT